MAANELDSFVYKFKNLWRNGQEASLNVKSKAGRAWIELHVELGHPLDLPPPYIYHQDGVKASTSRDRRRNRRATHRAISGLKASEKGATVDAEPTENFENSVENIEN